LPILITSNALYFMRELSHKPMENSPGFSYPYNII
jgi:hypothetical protein